MRAVDLVTHFRAMWYRRWLIAGGAMACGLLVFGVLRVVNPVYRSETSLFVVPASGNAASDTELRRLTVAYLSKSSDPVVLLDAAQRAPGTPTAQALRKSVKVTSPTTGELRVLAKGTTPEDASRLANAMSDAMSRAVSREESAARLREAQPLDEELAALAQRIGELPASDPVRTLLTAQRTATAQARLDVLTGARNRLDVVQHAQSRDAVRTPRTARDSLLAFLLAGIVLSEASALLARRRGGFEGRDPVRALESWTELPVFRVPIDGAALDESAAAMLYLTAEDDGTTVVLAPLSPGRWTRAGVARLLSAAAEVHGAATWVHFGEATDDPLALPEKVYVVQPPQTSGAKPQAVLAALPSRPGPTIVSADSWESVALLQVAANRPLPCLLLIDAHQARKTDFDEASRVLTYAGANPTAVAVVVGPRNRWGTAGS